MSDSILKLYCAVMVIAIALTGVALLYARRRQLLDLPGDRRSHVVATARGGGIAIVVVTLLAMVVLWDLGRIQPTYFGFGFGFVLVAIVGWIDDHRPLSAKWRLAAHLIAALAFAASILAELGVSPMGMMMAGLAFCFCLGLTNVWNFMDGINGIAAGTAVVVFLAYSLFNLSFWGGLSLIMSATCFGFLFWNFPKALIFMGDVGSGAIGFAIGASMIMACIWLMTDLKDMAVYANLPRIFGFMALLAAPLAGFLVDAAMTLGRRIWRREEWWTAHAQHSYQALARRYGHPRVTLLYVVIALAGIVILITMTESSPAVAFCSGLIWYIWNVIFWLFVQNRFAKQES